MFNKKKTPTPTGEGLGGIDLSDMRDKIYQEDPGAVGIENKFNLQGVTPKKLPLYGKMIEGGWPPEYQQPEEWSTQDFPVRSDFYPGIKTSTTTTGTGMNTLADYIPEVSWSDTRW